jgi:hypothetical protein
MYLFYRDRAPVNRLVKSLDLWKLRNGNMFTLYFIKQDDYEDILHITEVILNDGHNLV